MSEETVIKQIICIGYDPREEDAYKVAVESAKHHAPPGTLVTGVHLSELVGLGWYRRRTEIRNDKLWDVISEAPMSTEFAISRFLSIEVADHALSKAGLEWDFDATTWVMFMDCDMLVRKPLAPLFELANKPENLAKAVLCVQHKHEPPEGVKMDGQAQLQYARKNWSSVMLINPFNHTNMLDLTIELVNTVPGRDLHRFCWLKDEEIGAIPTEYNWLVGHSPNDIDPVIVHFTEGGPWFEGYKDVPYADEWLEWHHKIVNANQ